MGIELQKRECASCGEPFDSAFCPNCGERRLTEKDYSAFSLVNDFIVDVFNLENKLWRTFRTFLVRPAEYVDEYIKGARKKFISPIKLFLIANAWYFLFPAMDTFKSTWNTQLHRLPHSDLLNGFLVNFQEKSGLSYSEFEGIFNDDTTIISKLFLVILPLIFGVLTYVLYLNKQKETPIIHHFNHSLTIYAFLLFFATSTMPILYNLVAVLIDSQSMQDFRDESTMTIFIFLIMNTFGYLLYKKFFAEKWYHVLWKVLTLNFLFIPLLQIYRFILLWITLGWLWLTA